MKKRTAIFFGCICAIVFFRPPSLDFLQLSYSTLVNDRNGDLLSARIAEDEQWRFPVMDAVPLKFEKAIVTFEDKRYYFHPGVDPFSLVRAIRQNVEAGKVVSGASTITMQLARLASGHESRTIWNKLKEVNFALRLEFWNSKKDILKWYCSLAPFGGNVIGLEAACWRYFGKSPDQLSWAEAATLAVLPNSPALIHLNRNRDKLRVKRDRLLYKLHLSGILDDLDLEAAESESLPDKLFSLPNEAPHYLHYLQKKKGNIRFTTSVLPEIQKATGEVMDQLYLEWKDNEVYNAATLILDTKSGDVLAYHGNIPSTSEERAVDMVQARRSSGSILKPFLYSHMINEGLISPASLVWDIPTYISGFNPTNYNKSFSGAIHSDAALRMSLNVPAVRMLQKYGTEKFLYHLKEHGFSSLSENADHYGLSLILGGGEVTLWDLANAYRGMGAALLNDEKFGTLSPGALYQTLEALKDLSRPDEEGDWRRMDSRSPIAWKTGTSYGHRDAWAIGVTPEYTIACWVGNADGEGRDGIIGTSTAGRLMFGLMGILEHNGNWFEPPFEEMTYLSICSQSGYLASSYCVDVVNEYYPEMVEKSGICPFHTRHFVSSDEMYRMDPSCSNGEDIHLKTYFDLPPLVSQYYLSAHPEYITIPPFHPDCTVREAFNEMEFIYPLQNDVIYLPKDFNQNQQGVIVKLAHRQPAARIFWYLDEEYLGETSDFHGFTIIPESGHHLLTVVDDQGNSATRSFQIIDVAQP